MSILRGLFCLFFYFMFLSPVSSKSIVKLDQPASTKELSDEAFTNVLNDVIQEYSPRKELVSELEDDLARKKIILGITDLALDSVEGLTKSNPYSFAGSVLAKGSLKLANEYWIDESRPEREANEKYRNNVLTMKELMVLHPERRAEFFDAFSGVLIENKTPDHFNVLVKGAVGNIYKLINEHDSLILDQSLSVFDSQRRIHELEKDIAYEKKSLHILTKVEIQKESLLASDLISDEGKRNFLEGYEEIKKGVLGKDKDLIKKGAEKASRTILDYQSVTNKFKQAQREKLNFIENKLNRPLVQIGGMDFSEFAAGSDANKQVVDRLAIGYSITKSLSEIAQLMPNSEVAKVFNDSFILVHNMTLMYHSFSVLTSTATAVGAAAKAGAASSGVGAAVAIVKMISGSSGNKTLAKALKAIFKQLKAILEMNQQILKNQRVIVSKLDGLEVQSLYIIRQLDVVLGEIEQLSQLNTYSRAQVLASVQKLEGLVVDLDNRQRINIVNEKINHVIRPFHKLENEAKGLDRRFLREEIDEPGRLEEVLGWRSDLKRRIDNNMSSLGNFIVSSRQESNELGLIFQEDNNIFSQSFLNFSEHTNLAAERSQFLVDIKYQTPDEKAGYYYPKTELYDYSYSVMANNLPKLYNWVMAQPKPEMPTLGEPKLDLSKKQILPRPINTYFLFKLTLVLVNSIENFANYSGALAQGVMDAFKRRLNAVKDEQKAYRAALAVAVASYRDKSQRMFESYSDKVKLVPPKKDAPELAKLVFSIQKLKRELQKVESMKKKGDHQLVYSYDQRYTHENNSQEKPEAEPSLKGKTITYDYVYKKSVPFSRSSQKNIKGREIIEISDFYDLRLPLKALPRNTAELESSEFATHPQRIKPFMDFVDLNPLAYEIERMAITYGLVRPQSFSGAIQHGENYTFHHVFVKRGFYYTFNSLESRKLFYPSYGVFEERRLKDLKLHYNNPYAQFGDNTPAQLKEPSLIYGAQVRGRLAYPEKNQELLDKSVSWAKSSTKFSKLLGNIPSTEINSELASSILARGFGKSLYAGEFPGQLIPGLLEHPPMTRKEPTLHHFDVIYADGIEAGVEYLHVSLKALLIAMNRDLAELYRLAAVNQSTSLKNISETLEMKGLYKELGIDVDLLAQQLQADLSELEHLRLAMYHFTQAGYAGCENRLPVISYLLNTNQIKKESSVHKSENHLFDEGEIVSVQQIAKFAHRVKGMAQTSLDLKSIGSNKHLAYLFKLANEVLPKQEEMLLSYRQGEAMSCGQIAVGVSDSSSENDLRVNYMTAEGLLMRLKSVESVFPHAFRKAH